MMYSWQYRALALSGSGFASTSEPWNRAVYGTESHSIVAAATGLVARLARRGQALDFDSCAKREAIGAECAARREVVREVCRVDRVEGRPFLHVGDQGR